MPRKPFHGVLLSCWSPPCALRRSDSNAFRWIAGGLTQSCPVRPRLPWSCEPGADVPRGTKVEPSYLLGREVLGGTPLPQAGPDLTGGANRSDKPRPCPHRRASRRASRPTKTLSSTNGLRPGTRGGAGVEPTERGLPEGTGLKSWRPGAVGAPTDAGRRSCQGRRAAASCHSQRGASLNRASGGRARRSDQRRARADTPVQFSRGSRTARPRCSRQLRRPRGRPR